MALKSNIPTVKLPEPMEVPDFSKSLASLMQAYSRMARMQAAASSGGTGPGSGKGYWVEYPNPADPSQPIRYWVGGDSTDIRKANLEQIQKQHAQRVVSGDTQLREKLHNLDQYSAKKASDILKDIRKNDLPRLSAASGVNVSSLLNEMLRPMQTNVNERLKAIEDDPTWNILWQKLSSEGEIAFKNLWDYITPNDARADVAHGEEINRIRQEAEANSAYLREQSLRAQEGEGWLDRSEGVGGNLLNSAIAVAEALPNVGMSITLPTVGLAVGGPAGFAAGLAAAGGINASATRGEFLARVAADPNLTESEKAGAATEGETLSSLVGFGTGVLPIPLGRITGQALGAMSKRMFPSISNAISAPASRSVGTFLKRDAPASAYEGGVMSGLDMMGQNIIYEHATGLDTPVLQNVGDAILMGAIGGAPFGAVQTASRAVPRPTSTEAAGPLNVDSGLPALPAAQDSITLPLGNLAESSTAANANAYNVPVWAIPESPIGSTTPPASDTPGPVPLIPQDSLQLDMPQNRSVRPIPMGTDETVTSSPIEMGMSLPDTPEQRLYNSLATINKSDKNAEAKLREAVQTYGQEGGTLDTLAVFAKQARLSNKNLAALPADQRLFVGSKLTNAPLRELADLIKLAETDDTILGVRSYGEEGSNTGSGESPAAPGMEPTGQQGTAAPVGTDIIIDSGVATPIGTPVEGAPTPTPSPVIGGDRAAESGGTGGTPIQSEPANQILESIAQPEGAGPATDTSVSGSDNRLSTDSGTLTNQSTGRVIDQGGGSNDRPKNAANFSSEQQSSGETRVRRRIIVDDQASQPSSDVRPADVVAIGKKGVFDTEPSDVTASSKRTAKLIETLKEVAESFGLDPIVPDKSSMASVKKLKVSQNKKETKSNTPIKEATESEVLNDISSIDPRLVSASQKNKAIEALYNEALGEKLSKADRDLLNKLRTEYGVPRIKEFADPNLTNGDSIDKLINSLPPKFWVEFIGKHIGSAGHVLNSIRNGLSDNSSPIAQSLRANYESIRNQAHALQNIRIADSLAKSDSVHAGYARKVLTETKSAKNVSALSAARDYGLPDVDLPPNFDAAMTDASVNGINVSPIMMARALMDPDSAHAKIINQKFCPPV